MFSTRTLYASTLMLAGAAGFSSGWAVKPDAKAPPTEEERVLAVFDREYDLSAEDREALGEAVHAYMEAIRRLREEVSRQYDPQINAIQDRYDAVIAGICTDDKRRDPGGK